MISNSRIVGSNNVTRFGNVDAVPILERMISFHIKFKDLHFHDFKIERYPIVSMAEVVMRKKGSYGAVFNASNEVAVNAFLKHEIPFLEIENIITTLMNQHRLVKNPDYEKLAKIDKKTRKNAMKLVKEWRMAHD